MLDGDTANITLAIYVQQGVLVQVPGFCDFGWSKLSVKRVCVLKVLNFHGLNELSKNALCTVSRSGRSIIRKYFRFISAIGAKRPDAPIALDYLSDRMIDNVMNALIANNRALRTSTSRSKYSVTSLGEVTSRVGGEQQRCGT